VSLSWLPLAASAGVAALLLVSVYWILSSSLAARSDPVFGDIQGLRLTPPVVATPQPAPKPRLAQFLQPDIKANLVRVSDEIDRSVVTIRGDGTFATGSATLLPEREALVGRIADALALVTGQRPRHRPHRQPADHAQRPLPVELAPVGRAGEKRRDILVSHKVSPDRIRAEGRADAEPVVPNDTVGNRALNRRVEVTLFVGRGAEASASRPQGK
jgi:type VI secretion system protein ImpK